MKNPKLSIMTPSFNSGDYIEETIKSVLEQDYDNFEYFIIDGGSTDNTLNIIKKYEKKYPDKIKWISKPDNGQTDAINKALRMSSGDWFAWINADDYYESNIFSKLISFLKNHPNAGVVYGNCFEIQLNGKRRLMIPPKRVSNRFLRIYGSKIYGPSSFFNMKSLKKIGEFDEKINYWMDYEMYVRISKYFQLKYVPLNIANFRLLPNQKSKDTNTIKISHRELDKLMRKNNGFLMYYMIKIVKKIKKVIL